MENYWLARDLDGELYLYKPHSKPMCKGSVTWQYARKDYDCIQLPRELFPNVTWEDRDPTPINLSSILAFANGG